MVNPEGLERPGVSAWLRLESVTQWSELSIEEERERTLKEGLFIENLATYGLFEFQPNRRVSLEDRWCSFQQSRDSDPLRAQYELLKSAATAIAIDSCFRYGCGKEQEESVGTSFEIATAQTGYSLRYLNQILNTADFKNTPMFMNYRAVNELLMTANSSDVAAVFIIDQVAALGVALIHQFRLNLAKAGAVSPDEVDIPMPGELSDERILVWAST